MVVLDHNKVPACHLLEAAKPSQIYILNMYLTSTFALFSSFPVTMNNYVILSLLACLFIVSCIPKKEQNHIAVSAVGKSNPKNVLSNFS